MITHLQNVFVPGRHVTQLSGHIRQGHSHAGAVARGVSAVEACGCSCRHLLADRVVHKRQQPARLRFTTYCCPCRMFPYRLSRPYNTSSMSAPLVQTDRQRWAQTMLQNFTCTCSRQDAICLWAVQTLQGLVEWHKVGLAVTSCCVPLSPILVRFVQLAVLTPALPAWPG